MTDITRRSALQLAGLGAVALTLPVLAGCTTSTSSSVAGGSGKLVPFPKYVPLELVKADLPGDAAGVQDAYLSYPRTPTKTVKDTPGDGSVVTAILVTYGAVPAPAAQNKLWTAINKALGVDLQLTLVNSADLNAKFATLMAGGELPDIVGCIDLTMPNVLQFVQAKCADLSDYISGDKVKAYPNLANLPPFTWTSVGRIGGRLYGIPVPRARMGGALFANAEKFSSVGILKGASTDDFSKGLASLADARHYPIGGSDFGAYYHLGCAGIPSNWRLDGKKIVTTFDDPAYPEVLSRMAGWYKNRLMDPDTLTVGVTQANTKFQNGTSYSLTGGIGGYPGYVSAVGDSFTVDFVRPYGSKPTPGLGNGIFSNSGQGGFTALKKASPDRIKMLLRVLDYLAAPFGSTEYELVNYGVEGVHFTRGADGTPQLTALATTGGENSTNLPVKYLAAGPYALYLPGFPEATKRSYQAQKDIIPLAVPDPSTGLVSATQAAHGATIMQPVTDAVNDIISGKRPASDWKSVVATWKQQGGSKIASELTELYAKAH